MKKWQIKSKKDWCIAFIFTFLIVSSVVSKYTHILNEYMTDFMADKMYYTHQPSGYANMIVVVAIMTVIVIGVMCYKRKAKWALTSGIAGTCLVAIIFGGYKLHCQLIVETPSKVAPTGARVINYRAEDTILEGDTQIHTLAKLAYELKRLDNASEEEIKQQYNLKERNDLRELTPCISITFPEKYGRRYDMNLYILEEAGVIAMARNDYLTWLETDDLIRFYEDNGLIKQYQDLLSQQGH